METIKSHHHIFRFYAVLIFSTIFIGFISIACITAFFFDTEDNGSGSLQYNYGTLVAGVALLLSLVYVYVYYMANAPDIEIDANSITFNSKKYQWNEIEKIEFTGKFKAKYYWTSWNQLEGMCLTFKGGEKKYIFDRMYSNSPEMKNFIQNRIQVKNATLEEEEQVILPTKSTTISQTLSKHETPLIQNNPIDKTMLKNPILFKGNFLFSIHGALSIIIVLFIPITCLIDQQIDLSGIERSAPLLILLFMLNIRTLYYFGITEGELIVKNHLLFWIKKTYRLEDIRDIVLESSGKLPNRMRIIFKDYRTKKIYAGTLWDRDWRALKIALESSGVSVRDELYTN